jgi:DNA-binding response OmpR family regulator
MADETILVVDDSLEIARVLDEYMLTPQGYKVLHAGNGQKGLAQAIAHNPDLILLDMNMPRMSGIEMLEQLRQTDYKAPVIFMTMHGSERVAVDAFRLGVSNYLIKPFAPE